MIRRLLPLALLLAAAVWPAARGGAAAVSLDNLLHNSPFGGPAAAVANRSDAPLEFRSLLVEGGKDFFSIYEVSSHTSLWVGLNEPGNPFTVQSYDAAKEVVTVEYRNRVVTLPIKASKIVAMALPTPPPAPPMVSNGQPGPGPIQNLAAVAPAEEAARLAAIAEEIRRRRALRSAPPQPGAPPPGQGPRPVRN